MPNRSSSRSRQTNSVAFGHVDHVQGEHSRRPIRDLTDQIECRSRLAASTIQITASTGGPSSQPRRTSTATISSRERGAAIEARQIDHFVARPGIPSGRSSSPRSRRDNCPHADESRPAPSVDTARVRLPISATVSVDFLRNGHGAGAFYPVPTGLTKTLSRSSAREPVASQTDNAGIARAKHLDLRPAPQPKLLQPVDMIRPTNNPIHMSRLPGD